MAAKDASFKYEPYELLRTLFGLAKHFWTVNLGLKILAFAISGVGILYPTYSKLTFYAAVALALTSEGFQLQSDAYKGLGEGLLRRLERRSGLGWSISGRDLSDLALKVPPRIRRTLPAANGSSDNYHESAASIGAVRTLENLRESAWWSSQLSQITVRYLAVVTGLLIIASFTLLIVTVENVGQTSPTPAVITPPQFSRLATSILLLIFSSGLLRLTIGYWNFGRKCSDIVRDAEEQVGAPSQNTNRAIASLGEYHVARSNAPLIPELIYELNKGELNELWSKYCTAK